MSRRYTEDSFEELPPEVVSKFHGLATAQRGGPEEAMLEAQKVMGHCILSDVIEHVGDLTHRMAQWAHAPQFNMGYADVEPKVRYKLQNLRRPLLFEEPEPGLFRKVQDAQLEQRAEDRGISLSEQVVQTNKALGNYASEHAALPVYNRAQRWARDAAVALGRREYEKAEKLLSRIEPFLRGSKVWAKFASEY